jgi:hypothetical protein
MQSFNFDLYALNHNLSYHNPYSNSGIQVKEILKFADFLSADTSLDFEKKITKAQFEQIYFHN